MISTEEFDWPTDRPHRRLCKSVGGILLVREGVGRQQALEIDRLKCDSSLEWDSLFPKAWAGSGPRGKSAIELRLLYVDVANENQSRTATG